MIGKTISHYRILEKLGEGGMGVVYKAQDAKLDRTVALKFLPPHLTKKEADLARFVQEAKAAAALNHPNVCTIYEIHDEGENPFIVMEYVGGRTLRDMITGVGAKHSVDHIQKKETIRAGNATPLQMHDVIDHAIQIAEALKAAHEKGIIHRDVKSENIMVTETSQVKVMDFGLAKLRFRTDGSSVLQTKPGTTLGTVAYSSPEQLQGKDIDVRTDIFSFGVVLYEMLTGHLPFQGEYDSAMMYAIINEEPEPIQKFRSDLSSEMYHVLNRALEKNPEERYQSTHDMLIDLKRLKKDINKSSRVSDTGSRGVDTTPTPITEYEDTGSKTKIPITLRRKKYLTILAAALGIMILVIAAILFFRGDDTIDSLAILPFENVSGDENTEYLSEGIPESIISSLQKIPGLKITSFNSVLRRFKNKTPEASDVRDEFEVDAVVMGRIWLQGEDISVSIEIVETRHNHVLAAENFLEKLVSLVNIQPTIAREITEKLSIELSAEDENRVFTLDSPDSEAYDKYITGRYYWRQRTVDGFSRAMEYFRQAIDIDPEYALAYSGLADCYILSQDYYLRIPDFLHKAREAAESALKYGPDLAESHTSMGYVLYWEDNTEAGKREFEKALDIDPDYPPAHYWYGESMSIRESRHEEGIEEIKKALELDPYSIVIHVILGRAYYEAGLVEEGIDQLEKTIAMDPEWPLSYLNLARIYMSMNEHDEVIEVVEKFEGDESGIMNPSYYIGISYLIQKDYEKAIEFLRQMPPGNLYYGSGKSLIALTYGLRGQYKTSIDMLVQNAKARGGPYIDEIYRKTFSQGVFNEETYKEFFKNMLDKAVELNHPMLELPFVMNFIYLYAEEYDLFFVELERWMKTAGAGVLALPFYDPVRDDPRFVELWERYGLSKYYQQNIILK